MSKSIGEGRFFEVGNLFQGGYLNYKQIENIRLIMEVLARYGFVDRNILNKRANKEIGLSYLMKAVKYNMVTMIHDKENDKYYYHLGYAGTQFMNNQKYNVNDIGIMTILEEKKRILSMNRFIINNGYELADKEAFHDRKMTYFFGDEDRIYYYKDEVSYEQLVRKLLGIIMKGKDDNRKPVYYTKNEFEEKFNLIQIDEEMEEISAEAKRADEKE